MTQKPPFWSRVNKDAVGCWEWTGPVNAKGYGWHGRETLAHRIAYRELVGEIPEGTELDHLCANRQCVNPDHLEPVSHADNVRRGSAAARKLAMTHCKHGHEYTPENTLRYGKRQNRACKTCDRARREKAAA